MRTLCLFESNQTTRTQQIYDLFKQCCDDGQLTRTVMGQIRFGVSIEEYNTILKIAINPITDRLFDRYTDKARLSMKTQQTRLVLT
jgi:hypothetical protein